MKTKITIETSDSTVVKNVMALAGNMHNASADVGSFLQIVFGETDLTFTCTLLDFRKEVLRDSPVNWRYDNSAVLEFVSVGNKPDRDSDEREPK